MESHQWVHEGVKAKQWDGGVWGIAMGGSRGMGNGWPMQIRNLPCIGATYRIAFAMPEERRQASALVYRYSMIIFFAPTRISFLPMI